MRIDNDGPFLAALSYAEESASKRSKLLERFGSAKRAWETARQNSAIGSPLRLPSPEQAWEMIQASGARICLPAAPDYPKLLRHIPDPPPFLFAFGGRLASKVPIAVVGTRRPTRYGIEVATALSRQLADAGFLIVSGLAAGIDAAAHRGALRGAETVAVLGCGIDVDYPKANGALRNAIAREGVIFSEYPPGVRPAPHRFPVRNRVISGMSCGTVVVEATDRGGALITARCALEQGREVFAVPGSVFSPQAHGPHALIQDGAKLVRDASDIIDEIGHLIPELGPGRAQPEKVFVQLEPNQERVLGVLEGEATTLDVLAASTGFRISELSAILAQLEILGVARREPGSRFARCNV